MSLIKSITKSDGFRAFLCWIGAQYIRLVYLTGRWDVVNGDVPRKFWDEDKPFILAFWHGRILLMPYCWDRKKNIHMLISAHRDGQLIARTVGHFGIHTIEGSTSKGGATALRAMLKSLKNGECIGITPDGPRGPRMRASAGVVNVAKMSGVPVIPCAFGAAKRKHVRSWDRFCVAWPFSKGVFVWGDPIHVPKTAKGEELDQYQQVIEDQLTHVTNEADRLTGHPPVEAAAK
ncbi:lysophospholipid acyltransferase family protein [Terasakiella sp. SH-1]|uniref:lysophospholipid acyltransferase family protein n=1 Tax=Terasakiella sp. SH-1 TaxID=2560057 RepID=UPI001072F49F|nr:lysophospholipid acyltransferase family protein [Terasakiella sp. SH-1]